MDPTQTSQPPAPQPPTGDTVQQKPNSIAAIVALVLGILALITSILPIINNLSFVIALIGVVFAIVGLVGTLRGKKRGKGLAIASVIINVVAIAVVLYMQSMFSAALDQAIEESNLGGTQAASTSSESSNTDFSALAIGEPVELENGLVVTVTSVQTDLKNHDDSDIIGATITYTNNSDEKQSFNVFDWNGRDSKGAERSTTYYSDSKNDLSSGELAPGGTASGNIYFDAPLEKIVYDPLTLGENQEIAWVVG